MDTAKSFDQFFSDDLSGILGPLEQERRKLANMAYISFFIGGLSAILFLISSGSELKGAAVPAAFMLGAAVIVYVMFSNRKQDYVSSFKEKIVRHIMSFVDPSLSYKPDMLINEDDYDRSGLFRQKADSYEGDDYVEGKRDKTFFCFSELHTQYRVSSGKSTSWITIFRGLFFIADFNKNFSGRTYVWTEQNPQLDFFSRHFSSFASGLEKVKLESTAFENKFIVYGSDQVEARYILTPSFMERMVKLEGMMGSGISFSFVNTNIHVAVPINENLFEPSVFSANDYLKLGDYYNTIHIVFDIIDELKLNQRLWTKE